MAALSRRDTTTGYPVPGPGRGGRISPEKLQAMLVDLAYYVGVLVAVAVVAHRMDPQRKEKEAGRESTKRLIRRLNRDGRKVPQLNEYEMAIAQDIIDPAELNASFDSIGGLDGQKEELINIIILPLRRPDLFRRADGKPSTLTTQPRGILLYGAPGTGKTLLAKAIAAESGAAFLNLRMSTIMTKWFGESNKLVAAVFSLAKKLSPTVIFIDEIDSFMRRRQQTDDVHISTLKSEFMTLWDGMLTTDQDAVVILGATNRPFDVDQAILRRLPRTFEIGLPDEASRLNILEVLLRDEDVSQVDLSRLASLTYGYSGSDLKELCRAAVIIPIHELAAKSRSAAAAAEAGGATSVPAANGVTNGYANGNANGCADGHSDGNGTVGGANGQLSGQDNGFGNGHHAAGTVNGGGDGGAAGEGGVVWTHNASSSSGTDSDAGADATEDEEPFFDAQAAANSPTRTATAGGAASAAAEAPEDAPTPLAAAMAAEAAAAAAEWDMTHPRLVCDADFDRALTLVQRTGAAAGQFNQRQGQDLPDGMGGAGGGASGGGHGGFGGLGAGLWEWVANPANQMLVNLYVLQMVAQISRQQSRTGGSRRASGSGAAVVEPL